MRIDGRAVAPAVGEVDRRLVAGHQALVAVGRRIGEGAQGRGVLEQAADGVQGHVGQAGVAASRRRGCVPSFHSEVWTCMPRAVVPEERLGHEGGRLAVLAGDVLDDVLVLEHVVGHLDQRRVTSCRFRPGRRWPLRGAGPRSSRPHSIMVSIISVRMSCRASDGGHGEIAFLVAELVAEVGLLVAAGVPGAFDAVDEVVAASAASDRSGRRRR